MGTDAQKRYLETGKKPKFFFYGVQIVPPKLIEILKIFIFDLDIKIIIIIFP